MYLFIAQNGDVSPGFPMGVFVCVCVCVCVCEGLRGGGGGGGGRAGGASSLQIFGRFAQGYAETGAFRGDFLAGELGEKKFVF